LQKGELEIMDSIKLLDVLEENIEEVARHWIAEVKKIKERLAIKIFPMINLLCRW